MTELFINGKQLIDENSIHPNLLNNSVGPFPPNTKAGINYDIFDNSTVNLIEGHSYCISCESDGNLCNKQFNGQNTDNDFLFYLYTPDRSKYFPILGLKSNTRNSIVFKAKGKFILCVQYKAMPNSKAFPTVKNVKIEDGTKATAWIPSSHDLSTALVKMGGVKLRYKLYINNYTTSVKEVA